jgi:dimethylhistidine N-methyltransferase
MASVPELVVRHAAPRHEPAPQITVQRVDSPAERQRELRQGLLDMPARIAPKFFYDAQGCALYEALCQLDEYYPPRAESQAFSLHRQAIAAALPRHGQLVDLGCGDGAKAARWLEPLAVRRYIGVDIAADWLGDTLKRGASQHPGVAFDGVVTDFTRGLQLQDVLHDELPTLFFYPGSSIGNFAPADALRLLSEIRAHLKPDDRLLIGVDAPKDRDALVAAYDDALGVTAAFNRNVLRVVNRELGSDFMPAAFEHRALFSEAHSRIEMHLVSRLNQTVQLGRGQQRRFEAGEAVVTEYSYKYSPQRFTRLLAHAGFGSVQHWSDAQGWFNVYVAAPAAYAQ